jgi:cellulose synthase/poly-beta-1,6-N-acetylglucosamine synthase-like glycosyltransferase
MSLPPPTPLHATATDDVLISDATGPLSAGDLSERFAGRVAVVIPAYDEAENLAELLPRVPDRIGGVPAAVLVVDDGSTDDTPAAVLAAGAVLARLPENRGGGAALRIGYAVMVAAGAGVVVTMDADGQHQPEEIARLVEPVIGERAELVQGSRVLGSSEPGAFARELGIALFNRLVRVLTRVRVTDCSNSFRAIRTDLLAELDLRQPQFHAAEFLIEGLTRGFVFEEVPVDVLSRRHGQSKKPATVRYGLGFCWAIISAWRRSILRRDTIQSGARPAHAGGAAQSGGQASRQRPRLTPDRHARMAPRSEREDSGGDGVADTGALLVGELGERRPEHD